jgi:hypothetical protein
MNAKKPINRVARGKTRECQTKVAVCTSPVELLVCGVLNAGLGQEHLMKVDEVEQN